MGNKVLGALLAIGTVTLMGITYGLTSLLHDNGLPNTLSYWLH